MSKSVQTYGYCIVNIILFEYTFSFEHLEYIRILLNLVRYCI